MPRTPSSSRRLNDSSSTGRARVSAVLPDATARLARSPDADGTRVDDGGVPTPFAVIVAERGDAPLVDVLYAMTVYSAAAAVAPVTQMFAPLAVTGTPTAGEVAVAVPAHGEAPAASTVTATESERPDAVTVTVVVPPVRSARTSPTPSTLTSVGSATVNVGTKSVTSFANSSCRSDVMRAV